MAALRWRSWRKGWWPPWPRAVDAIPFGADSELGGGTPLATVVKGCLRRLARARQTALRGEVCAVVGATARTITRVFIVTDSQAVECKVSALRGVALVSGKRQYLRASVDAPAQPRIKIQLDTAWRNAMEGLEIVDGAAMKDGMEAKVIAEASQD